MGNKDELKNRLQLALELNDKRPIDLCKAIGLPKSTVSQYLSGKSKNMTAERLNDICKFLNVSEAWMMGYDVPMERKAQPDKSPAASSELSEAQAELLDAFNNLNTYGQQEAIKRVSELTEIDRYKKQPGADSSNPVAG